MHQIRLRRWVAHRSDRTFAGI